MSRPPPLRSFRRRPYAVPDPEVAERREEVLRALGYRVVLVRRDATTLRRAHFPLKRAGTVPFAPAWVVDLVTETLPHADGSAFAALLGVGRAAREGRDLDPYASAYQLGSLRGLLNLLQADFPTVDPAGPLPPAP